MIKTPASRCGGRLRSSTKRSCSSAIATLNATGIEYWYIIACAQRCSSLVSIHPFRTADKFDPKTGLRFKLTNRWRSKLYSFCFCGVFRVGECVQLIWQSYRKDCRECDVSFLLLRSMMDCNQNGLQVREFFAVFP